MDDEGDEPRNLLHGSVEDFDQEYDNALVKFERVRQNAKRTKTMKIFWTFRYLIRSVVSDI